ncbi:pyridoxamine 5'-phosphate oxidase [Saxibacter everestensis]|uniref:Pyridoxine/pyridoxamine 5'-phosphate oxidase n=1 Tax=Saxibacter everestensis TaxID=2909229 RepID=A0ABY8QV22_9MICO|nr:pyridoxamine 5'-phosphate oxidase [Brevibacteriaceae bacterium ZFBP1038]
MTKSPESQLPEVASQRVEYHNDGLLESDLADTPAEQFVRWFHQAESELREPNAVALVTADDSGPTARTVLLKGFDDAGFTIFTNYASLKSAQIDADPRVALLFPWHELERQVRVRGVARKVDEAASDAYFASRERGSQLGAWASRQSSPVSSRAEMESRLLEFERRFAGQVVPRPPHWGGFRIEPTEIEFWAGRQGRFHDRLVYASVTRQPANLSDSAAWRVERRYP